MKVIQIGGKKIGDGHPCLIIAEIGSNHDGRLTQAKKLVEIAAIAGCDAIKLQVPIADECYPPRAKFGNMYGEEEIFNVIRRNEIPAKWIPELVSYGHEHGLVVGASTDGFIGFEMIIEGKVDFLKIPSFTISHIPLLVKASRSGLPLLMSTGVHTLGQVEEALVAVNTADVGILHCISAYPAQVDALNLRNIPFLKDAFNIPVGFSDHSTHPCMAPAFACALGANMLEKHYTIDRSLKGTDHFFSLEPEELKKMVKIVKKVENDKEYKEKLLNDSKNKALLGSIRHGVFGVENIFKSRTRLGIYFIRSLAKGEKITSTDIRVLRCADTEPGLHPRYFDLLIGIAITCDTHCFEPVKWKHILQKEEIK